MVRRPHSTLPSTAGSPAPSITIDDGAGDPALQKTKVKEVAPEYAK